MPLPRATDDRPDFDSGRQVHLIYLVPEDAVPEFRGVVERLQAAHPDLGLVCTGPWPPYSFATAAGGAA